MRISEHPILGSVPDKDEVTIIVDGKPVPAAKGEPIAAALMANGIVSFRTSRKTEENRGVFCAIGRCTDCIMTVNGVPNIRTCVTPVEEGMRIKTQQGVGKWQDRSDEQG